MAAGSLLKISRYAVYIVGRLVGTPGQETGRRGELHNRIFTRPPGARGCESVKGWPPKGGITSGDAMARAERRRCKTPKMHESVRGEVAPRREGPGPGGSVEKVS
jgi:hypothetical protein